MKTPLILFAVAAVSLIGLVAADRAAPRDSAAPSLQPDGEWADVSLWSDGLVEKATYAASRVIYGKDREYEAVFLTNQETHELDTLTKSSGSGVAVWKHNQIEVIPTPNYDYKFVTTSHLTADDLLLTRLDATSQEWCGTSFHQFLLQPDDSLSFFGFSYMPGTGRQKATVSVSEDRPVLPFNALPVALRGFNFEADQPLEFRLILDQRSNRPTQPQPVDAVLTPAGETDDGYLLDLADADGKVIGRFEFAKDVGQIMLRYEGRDGQTYDLRDVERVDYWTIKE
jgi:hypothetical protein